MGCKSSNMKVSSAQNMGNGGANARKGGHPAKSSCLLGCDVEQRLNTVEREKAKIDKLRDYSHEPMFAIF